MPMTVVSIWPDFIIYLYHSLFTTIVYHVFTKGIGGYVDKGCRKLAINFNFPLLIVKNVEAPLIGGWLVNWMLDPRTSMSFRVPVRQGSE
jgi:hypothetical protein